MKMRFFMVIALLGAACGAQEAVPSGNVLTNRDVVTLADAGFGLEFIVEMIGTSRTEFDTTADAIAELRKHGVKDDIIRAMRNVHVSENKAAAPAFDSVRTEPIRVFVEAGPSPAQTAEIVHSLAVNCPALLVTSRKDAATFLIVLDRTARKVLRRATTKMVVFDRAGDTVYGSERPLGKAARGFCPLAKNLPGAKVEESLPGSRFSLR
jgi:hypothetical protein